VERLTAMASAPAKLLVLCIDAGSPTLLQQWAADGTLPNLAALADRGLVGETRSLEGFFVGSTWPSFYTGVSPAGHGLHYLAQLKLGSYELERPALGEFVQAEPFWRPLSRAGRRVAILDVPLCRLDPELNGTHVVEWGGHDPVFGFRTSPPQAAELIEAHLGRHPANHVCDAARRSADDYRLLVDDLVASARSRATLTNLFLRQGGWDLLLQVFTEAHCVGHQCWHLHDLAHPGHDPALAAELGDPLKRVYAAIDTSIGEILKEAGDTCVVVLSLHGMSHWYGAQFLLPEILFRLGVTQREAITQPPPSAASLALDAARWAWRRLPASLRRRMAPLRGRLSPDAGAALPRLGVSPASSRCFPVPNGLAVGGIRLNLAGREPEGILQAGPAADAFCAELTKDLLEIVDERTGGPLIQRVRRTRELFTGPHLDALPDLLVEWNDAAATGSTLVGGGAGAVVRAHSPKIGVVEGANRYCRTGEHRVEGLFIAAGPGIRPGRLNRVVSILDLAPSLAARLGVRLPDCEGAPIPELSATPASLRDARHKAG
jgi:predicted AlkP superfamily phosphohydrolase/phosphomutase